MVHDNDEHCSDTGCDKPAVYRLNPENLYDADTTRRRMLEADEAGIPVNADERALMVRAGDGAVDLGQVRLCAEHAALLMQDLADDQAADEVEARARWHKEIVAEGHPKELETRLLKAADDLLVDLRSRLPQGMPPVLIRL